MSYCNFGLFHFSGDYINHARKSPFEFGQNDTGYLYEMLNRVEALLQSALKCQTVYENHVQKVNDETCDGFAKQIVLFQERADACKAF
jgi:hypothetical protein